MKTMCPGNYVLFVKVVRCVSKGTTVLRRDTVVPSGQSLRIQILCKFIEYSYDQLCLEGILVKMQIITC
jgi:hypothetical protein